MKHISFVAVLCFFATRALSQGFYVKIHSGYNWPGFQNNALVMAPKVDASSPGKDELVPLANSDDVNHSYKRVSHSYAAGANLSLGLGYMITHWFGIELGAHYLWNSRASAYVRSDMTPIGFAGQSLAANINTYSKNGMTLTPLLVFVAAKKSWKVQPQAKVGLVLPFYGDVIHELEMDSPLFLPINPFFVGNKTYVSMKTQSSFSVGATAAVGIRYTPIPLLTIFADMTGQWLNIRAKKTTITQWDAYDASTGKTYNLLTGDPNDPTIAQRSTYRTEFVYVDELNSQSNNADYNSNYDEDKPKEDARITAPASNIGFQVGIQFNLGKAVLKSMRKQDTPPQW